ncbi:hypothetical protein BGZ74_004276 [Mortierella antarctica]|nr:hypothetical protein BGZ74_004276 [Mortierella antarctica]
MSDSRPHSTTLHTPLGRRRLLLSLSTLLFLASPHNLATAVKCLSPTQDSAYFTGDNFTVAWSVSFSDGYIYDNMHAELYCLDGEGADAQWRSLSTLFSATNIQYPQGQFQSRLPNCGTMAKMGAVRLTMTGFYGVFQTGDDCLFNILSPYRLTPDFNFPPPTSSPLPSSTLNKGIAPNPTTSASTAQPTFNPVPFTGDITTVPKVTTPTTVPVYSSGFQSSPATFPTDTTIPPSAAPTSAEREGGTLGQHAQTTSAPLPSGLPPHPPLPPHSSTGNDGAKSDSAKTIGAVIGTVGMAAALAVVVVSLMLVRRRRRMRMAGSEGSTSSLGPSTTGRGGRVMKEKKRKGPGLWGGRHGSNESGGHFVQMDSSDDEDDHDSTDGHDTGAVPRLHAVAGGVGVNAAGKSEISEAQQQDVVVVQRERGDASIATSTSAANGSGPSEMETTIAMPPHIVMDPTLSRRRYSLPMTESSAYSMSSIGSSFGASSVVRQYWAASEAARAERRRDTYGGRSIGEGEGYYTEGSIFGDQDTESRMADIVSRTENGSVGTFTTQRQRDHSLERRWARGLDRRNTLGSSIGESSSLHRTTTMTMSFSSIPSSMDSEEYHEQVYLNRLHMQGLRMREQELMMLHEHRMRQQEYHDHRPQYHHHPHDAHLLHHHHHHYPHHTDYIGTMTSRRSSSVPSLTSTNDPFKTFDSNELLDTPSMDPFSDSRAVTPIQLDMDDSLPPM